MVKYVGVARYVFSCLAVVACTSQVPSAGNDEATDLTDDGADFVANTPEVQVDLDEALPPVNCDKKGGRVGASPSRRLTVAEYERTLRDLFRGIDVGNPTKDHDFPTDVTFKGMFTNNATNQVILPRLANGYMNVAQSLSLKAVKDINNFLGCNQAADEDACAADFLKRFGERAFRRPLTDDERTMLVALYSAQKRDSNFSSAIQALVERILVSPSFLFRFENLVSETNDDKAAAIDDWSLASRISYLITGTMPDDELFEAARKGNLRDAKVIRAQVDRLLETPAAKTVMKQFFTEFYQTFRIPGSTKAVFPTYTPSVVTAMKDEVDRFFLEQFFSDGDTWKSLVSGSTTYINDDLAKHYGLAPPGSKEHVPVELDPTRSAGFLTLGGIMSMLAGPDDEHPEVIIYRGKWINERLLCWESPAVPLGVPPLEFSSEGLTNRQVLQAHVREPACAGCHQFIDPFGYPFENYDAVGRWRDQDVHGKPIDARGEISGMGSNNGPVNGPTELGKKLSESPIAKACFARRLFENASGREMDRELDVCTVRKMAGAIIETGSIKEALLAYVRSDALQLARTE